jgi:tetratricopeptide (TPR) repeat protein
VPWRGGTGPSSRRTARPPRSHFAAAGQLLAGAPPSEPLEIVGLLAADRALNTAQISGPEAAQAELDAFATALRARPGADADAIAEALVVAGAPIRSVAEALRALEAAATATDAPTARRVEWATMLDQLGRFDDATAAWRAASEADPGSYEAAYYWGVHHYNRASTLQDRDPTAFRAELEAARGPFEAAAALKPGDAGLRSTLVSLCAVTGDMACMKQYQAPSD